MEDPEEGYISISWLVAAIKYQPYLEAVPIHEFGMHSKEIDGHVFNVKKPGYLSLTGNLGVSKQDSMEGLLICPLLFGGYEYGFGAKGRGGL